MLIKDLLTQFYSKKLFPKAAALILFVALSSCTDQGCIDADDFGEYESQVVEVLANASQETCTYDSTLSLTDSGQGSSIKTCLTTGLATVIDENDVTKTSVPTTSGCNGFKDAAGTVDAKLTNLCVQDCVQKCLANSGMSSSGSEPNWTSTDKKESSRNIGVTIRPGSQIIMRAIGSVTLGDSASYPDIFVEADNSLPHSKKSNWGDLVFDVRNGQTLNIKFSGGWLDGGVKQLGLGSRSTIDEKAYNGARKLIAYLIPHPTGYDFDYSQLTEQSGVKGVPLLPDPAAWQCTYSTLDSKQSTCSNSDNGYTNNGYTNVNNTLANTTFPISSSFQTTTLTQYGGMIRWTGDGLESEDRFNPFTSSSCDPSGSCTGLGAISPENGKILGDASSEVSMTNNYSSSYKVSFKSLHSSCDTANLNVTVKDNSDNTVFNFTTPNSVILTAGAWSTKHIALEPGHKLYVRTSSVSSSGANCGKVIGVRLNRYHELTMRQSGFVSFAMLTQANSASTCNIKGRVVNPSGRFTDFPNDATFTKDFYEYDDFTAASSTDPLANLSVPTYTPGSATSWSNKVFVRKGQKIRFSPESWNSTWIAGPALSRDCGIGMAMRIDPRPAILCRGIADDKIPNSACKIPDYATSGANSGKLIGCQKSSTECDSGLKTDGTANPLYCPVSCRREITGCVDGTEATNFAKTACAVSLTAPASCTHATNPASTSATCDACNTAMKDSALVPAMVAQSGMDQCYDLESYTGKASNIPATNGFTAAQLADATLSKGAFKLGNFDGSYGNLEGFTVLTEVDSSYSNNKVLQLKTPLTFSKAGRLKFFVVDSNVDFSNLGTTYNNNSGGASYDGSNGFKIKSSSMLQFSNGQWLQARLCKESSDTSTDCKTLNPIQLAGTPRIIEITPPVVGALPGTPPVVSSRYKFDSYGNITRTATSRVVGEDCQESASNALYYCHIYQYFTDAQLKAKSDTEKSSINSDISKLRISFKILDPEDFTCDVSNSTTNTQASYNGIILKNPYYESKDSSGNSIVANVGQRCAPQGNEVPASPAPTGKSTCKKEFYCANKYSNNSGKYYVNVKVKSPPSGNVSSIIGNVVTPIIEVMDGKKDRSTIGQSERMYKLLIADPRYKALVTMCLVLMVTFYGFGYLIGVIEGITSSDLITRMVKIGLIYLFIGETGWDWFNTFAVKFFKDGTDYLAFMMASSFDNSPEVSDAITKSDYYDKSILFSSVDKVFSMFFSQAVQKKVSALLFASIFGWAYLMIIYTSFMLYVYSVANAVLVYLTAQVFLSILFTLGPIFFIFTLFKQTEEMFNNWVKQLISFSLQQIFLLTTLAFFNMMMYEVIKMSLGYKICWDEVWTINIITRITLLSFWTVASLPPRTNAQSNVGNIGNPDGIPSLFSILFIWVIASLMNKFIGFMTDLASGMAGGLSATKLGAGIADMAKQIKGMADKKMSQAWEKTGGQAMQRVDKALFDSGALADKEREARKKQNAADNKNKSALSSAGREAMSKFKKENGAKLAGMSKEDQVKELTKAKEDAIATKGKKLGLSAEDVTRLRNDKGFKYEGSNVFGAAASAIKQGAAGNLTKSENERNKNQVSTKFSNSEAKTALKGMSAEQRKEFVAAAKSGAIEVGRSNYVALKKAPSEAGKAIADGAKALGRVFTSPQRTAKNAMGYTKDYEAARDQLQAEGAVSKMRTGTGWARKDSEKKMIRERMKTNAAAKKADTSGPSATAATELERESNYLSEREAISSSSKEGGASMATQIIRRINAEVTRHAIGTSKKAEIKAGARKAAKSAVKNKVSKGKAEAEGALDSSAKMGDNARRDLESMSPEDRKEFAAISKNESGGIRGRMAARKAKAALTPQKKEAFDQYQRANAAINQSDAEVKNHQERLDTFNEAEKEIDHSEQVHNVAEAIATPKEVPDEKFSKQREGVAGKLQAAKDAKAKAPKGDKAAGAAVAKLEQTATAMDRSKAIYEQAKAIKETPGSSDEYNPFKADEVIEAYESSRDSGNPEGAFEDFADKYGKQYEENKTKAEGTVEAYDAIGSAEDFSSFAKKHSK